MSLAARVLACSFLILFPSAVGVWLRPRSKDGFDTVTQTVMVTDESVQTFNETLNPTTSSSMLGIGVIIALIVVAAIAVVVYRRR